MVDGRQHRSGHFSNASSNGLSFCGDHDDLITHLNTVSETQDTYAHS
jgi:hypothetical protein